jgi:hypothetical protein
MIGCVEDTSDGGPALWLRRPLGQRARSIGFVANWSLQPKASVASLLTSMESSPRSLYLNCLAELISTVAHAANGEEHLVTRPSHMASLFGRSERCSRGGSSSPGKDERRRPTRPALPIGVGVTNVRPVADLSIRGGTGCPRRRRVQAGQEVDPGRTATTTTHIYRSVRLDI